MDLTAFTAADVDAARDRARAEVTASMQAEGANALAAARADSDARVKAIAEAATALDPANARLGAFFAAVAAGTDVASATKIAGFVPVAAASAAEGRRADVATVLAGQAPGIQAETVASGNPATPGDERAAFMREIANIKVKL